MSRGGATRGPTRSAGLGVLVWEAPASEHKHFTLPNIRPIHHTTGPSWENRRKGWRNAFDNIEQGSRGEKPFWVVPELGD